VAPPGWRCRLGRFSLRASPRHLRKRCTGSTLVAHTQHLPSIRNIPTRSKSPRIVFLGIHPTGIRHVRPPSSHSDHGVR
jgi:hypothetical protein